LRRHGGKYRWRSLGLPQKAAVAVVRSVLVEKNKKKKEGVGEKEEGSVLKHI
jgi:hypothetical protein